MNRTQLEKSLKLWREREQRFRKNWKAHKKGDPRRFFWFKKLKQAVRMVNKRERDLIKLGVTSVSNRGLDLIKEFEGFARVHKGLPGLAFPYQDPVGVWTIGYGETRGISRFTAPWTKKKATDRLKLRVNRDFLAPVLAACKAAGFVPTQNEADALASLAYNLGTRIFERGHTMGDAIHSKDRRRIADAFLVYNKAGGKVLEGLDRRRRRERDLFLSNS
jgi:lysozyme